MVRYVELSDADKDLLRELGSIGTGNAVTSLSQLTEYPFEIKYPDLRFIKYQEICTILNTAEELETGIIVEISGELQGVFLFLLDETFTRELINTVLGQEERDLIELGDIERSFICEVGNIMCGSYIRALSQLLNIELDVSVPDMCIDMGGAIMGVLLSRLLKASDEVLLIENRFCMDGRAFMGRIVFLPEYSSLKTLLEHFGE